MKKEIDMKKLGDRIADSYEKMDKELTKFVEDDEDMEYEDGTSFDDL